MPAPGFTPDSSRPHDGWLKSTRLGLELGLREVAERLEVSPQAVHQFEKSELAGTISLRQLDYVARAMGSRVNYSLVPVRTARSKTNRRPSPAHVTVAAPQAPPPAPGSVEQSMFLENIAEGRFD